MQPLVATPNPSLGRADLRFALLNEWQRNFPLCSQPFDHIGTRHGVSGAEVIRTLLLLQDEGAISRIGGTFGIGAGGAGLLCAMAVPPADLAHVAARISRSPEVNHNYEREHRLNLWFVITAANAQRTTAVADAIAADTGLEVVRLPMRRAFHIDLGFDLRNRSRPAAGLTVARRPVPEQFRALAARLELGLPLTPRPYEALGDRCDTREAEVLRVLATWCHDGTLRRFGVIVRHHELGWTQNAMAVFDVAEDRVERCGTALAAHPGITLCYQRDRAPGWPYRLYCMVHGRSRAEVAQTLGTAARHAGLDAAPFEILFSVRRFKQTGSRYFAEALA